jgi:hypothetical protein
MIKPSRVRRLLVALIGALALTGVTAASASAATTSPAVPSPALAHAAAPRAADGIIWSSKPVKVTVTSRSPASPSATPHTFTNGCSSSQSTWVHGYATSYAWIVDNATWCVGNKGTTNLPYNSTLYICSGNNYGNIGYYMIVNGQRVDYLLNMPEDDLFIFASTVRVTHITINGWNFTYSC